VVCVCVCAGGGEELKTCYPSGMLREVDRQSDASPMDLSILRFEHETSPTGSCVDQLIPS
jgi:hypothetical protein